MPTKTVPALLTEEGSPLEDDIADGPVPATLTAAQPHLEDLPPALLPPLTAHASPSEPVVPTTALIAACCDAILAELHTSIAQHQGTLDRHIDAACATMRTWGERVFAGNEHAQYQLSSALDAWVAKGLPVLLPPYGATITVVSPQGFPVTLTISKREGSELMAALPACLDWLASQGYRASA